MSKQNNEGGLFVSDLILHFHLSFLTRWKRKVRVLTAALLVDFTAFYMRFCFSTMVRMPPTIASGLAQVLRLKVLIAMVVIS